MRIYATWMRLPAWRVLTPYAVTILNELLGRYRPGFNLMSVSERTAAQWGRCARATAAKALVELETCGWIVVERVGRTDGPKARRASAYSLTMYADDWGNPPTCAFKRWIAPRERLKMLPVTVRNMASNGSDMSQIDPAYNRHN